LHDVSYSLCQRTLQKAMKLGTPVVTKWHVNLLSPQEQPRPPVPSVRRILMTTVAPKMFGYGAFSITSVFRYHLLQALTFTIYEFAKMRPMSGWMIFSLFLSVTILNKQASDGIPLVACTAFATPRTMEVILCFQCERSPKLCQPSGWRRLHSRLAGTISLLIRWGDVGRSTSLELWW